MRQKRDHKIHLIPARMGTLHWRSKRGTRLLLRKGARWVNGQQHYALGEVPGHTRQDPEVLRGRGVGADVRGMSHINLDYFVKGPCQQKLLSGHPV